MRPTIGFLLSLLFVSACSSTKTTATDAGSPADAGPVDSGMPPSDAGSPGMDAGSACSETTYSSIESDCVCKTVSDCPVLTGVVWTCGASGQCRPDCNSSSCSIVANDCPSKCEPTSCAEDTECVGGYQCVSGSCVAATLSAAVSSCVVLPATAVLNSNGTKRFWVLAFDASGNAVPYASSLSDHGVTWAAAGGIVATPSTTAGASPLAYPNNSVVFHAGVLSSVVTGTVTASIGSTTCTPSSVTEYPAAKSGDLRVVAIDATTGAPVAGATVVGNSGTTMTTDSNGSVTFPGGAVTSNTVSVFATGYGYVSVVGTTAHDVLIPLRSTAVLAAFAGTADVGSFNGLPQSTGTVHMRLTGASVAGNLNDIGLPQLLGPLVETQVNLGNGSSSGLQLPDGIALGLESTMYKDTYNVTADPGYRVFWSIGGNADSSAVLPLLGASFSNDNFVGTVDGLLPYIDQMDTGLTAGVAVTTGETAPFGGTGPIVTLNTPQPLDLSIQVPMLPSWTGGAQNVTHFFDEALVFAGTMAGPQGFVPQGIGGGIDVENAAGASTPDQIIDPATSGGTPGVIPMTLSPRHGGVEPWPFAVIAVATSQSSFQGLWGLYDDPWVLSGKVLYPTLATSQTTSVSLGSSFLGINSQYFLDPSSRQLTLADSVAGAAFQRLDFYNQGTASGAPLWSVYFPAGESMVSVPQAASGFTDYYQGTEAVLQSVSLGYDSTQTFDSVLQFDGVDADDLTALVDQFSVRLIYR